jgi:CRISPR system Cascade subunit CasA
MDTPRLNLLDEPLIRIRNKDGQIHRLCLPELFVALGRDEVRDYPALRPHQRHPWHALLVQLAAIALHQASGDRPWDDALTWRKALLALTPEHPDGSAWSLVASLENPAFLQAPVFEGTLDRWKTIATPDALDMLVTSKNHDLKSERMRQVEPDDWLFALVSLQTQEGFLGAGNYGISRMNGGFSSRPAVGILPPGGTGRRWTRDVAALLEGREQIAETYGLNSDAGIGLVWLTPWDGTRSLAFEALDPLYVEICRRVRIIVDDCNILSVRGTGSKVARVNAAERKGLTGDAWTPVEGDKAMTLSAEGFHYRLISELAYGSKFQKTIAQAARREDGSTGLSLLAQGITRGQGKTEGYHERRVPLPPKVVSFLRSNQLEIPAKIAKERVEAIATMRGSVLRHALFALLEAGAERLDFDRRTVKQQVEPFVHAFEHAEDARFFDDLNREIESDKPDAERLSWMRDLALRAESVLLSAFVIGPQCGERRYRARSRALSLFHRALRNDKHFPRLAQYLREKSMKEEAMQ